MADENLGILTVRIAEGAANAVPQATRAAGASTKGFIKAAAVIAGGAIVVKKIHTAVNNISRDIQRLSRTNAPVAVAKAQADLGQVRRDITRGRVLQGSLVGIIQNTERLKNNLASVNNALSLAFLNVVDRVIAKLADFADAIGSLVNNLITGVQISLGVIPALITGLGQAITNALPGFLKPLFLGATATPMTAMKIAMEAIQKELEALRQAFKISEDNKGLTSMNDLFMRDLETLTSGGTIHLRTGPQTLVPRPGPLSPGDRHLFPNAP